MENGKYKHIIDLPHHVSDRHASMPRESRAAQFAPFAALTGYDDAVTETARLTENRPELGDDDIRALNAKLAFLSDNIAFIDKITLTYFSPDEKKEGGKIVTAELSPHRIDIDGGAVILTDKSKIKISDIIDINGEMLENIEF